MLRTLVTAILWALKALLLAVALTALFAWPWSHHHPGRLEMTRVTSSTSFTDTSWFAAGWGEGRIGVGRSWGHYADQPDVTTRGWQLEMQVGGGGWTAITAPAWGPLRWESH